MPIGRSDGSKRMSSRRWSRPRATPTAEMNSETTTSAPKRRPSSRKGDSDTPDMGARTSGKSCPVGYGTCMGDNVMTRCAGSNASLTLRRRFGQPETLVRLREFFAEDAVALALQSTGKDDVLKELVGLLKLDDKSEQI